MRASFQHDPPVVERAPAVAQSRIAGVVPTEDTEPHRHEVPRIALIGASEMKGKSQKSAEGTAIGGSRVGGSNQTADVHGTQR